MIEGQKIAPKFEIKFLSRQVPSDARIDELKYWCRIFHECNMAPPYEGGSFGNLSFRLYDNKDEFVVTGSNIGLKENLTNDKFIIVSGVDLDKKIVYAHGTINPSSESMLHYAIYKKRKDVNAVFHGHCQEILKHSKQLGVLCTLQEEEYGTVKLAESVLKILGDQNFIIMKGHGFISLGKTMKEAGDRAVSIYNQVVKKENIH